jgi:hypothetical protein
MDGSGLSETAKHSDLLKSMMALISKISKWFLKMIYQILTKYASSQRDHLLA